MSKSARLNVATAVLVMVLLVACGSSSNGVSKAGFVKRADAICKKYEVRIVDVRRTLSSIPGTVKRAKDAYLQQIVPLLRTEVHELRALKPPEADRSTTTKVFDDLARGTDQLASSVPKVASLRELGLLAPSGFQDAFTDAGAYGFVSCGRR